MTFPVVDREPVRLPTLAGHDDELWDALIELSDVRPGEWTLIGGQMVFLHAIEQGVTPPRVSTDLDVLVNARIAGRPIAAFASGLEISASNKMGSAPTGSPTAIAAIGSQLTYSLPRGSASAPI